MEPEENSGVPDEASISPWRHGLAAALLAPLFVALLGNLDGFAQLLRSLARQGNSTFESVIPGLATVVQAASGLRSSLESGAGLPPYDFWGPSRAQ